jgi:hypothetical protein
MKYCVCLLFLAAALSLPPTAGAVAVIALTENNEVMVVDGEVPQNVLSIQPITGLGAGEIVLGIDTRPADAKLYALTSLANFSTPRIFTIDPNTGAATLVTALTDGVNPFTQLSGTDFAIDFNPQADRLRVVSDTGQNLRINVDTGVVIIDTPLAYATPLAQAPHVNAIAYNNNFAGTASTRLFDVDDANFRIAEQLPPNNGTLVNPIEFGVPNAAHPGFDIAPDGTGYIAGKHTVPGSPQEYILAILDPLTAAGDSRGPIGDGSIAIRDIAITTSLTFSKTLYSIAEDGANATITVVRNGFLNIPMTAQFSTVSDTASAGNDYTTATGVLSFNAGEVSKTFQVPIKNDGFSEGDEFVGLLLSNVTGPAVLGPPASARLRISANDFSDEVGPQVLYIGLTGPSRGIDGAVIFYNEDMDPAAATNLDYYTLTVLPKRGKPVSRQFDSAVYDPARRTVTLHLNEGFMQTDAKKLGIRIRARGTTGVKDSYGNLLDGNRDGAPGGDGVQLFKVFSGTTLKFRDRDGDKVTLTLTGGGQLDGVLPIGGPARQQTQFWILDPIALVTKFDGSVTRSRTGDGVLVIAEIIGLDKKEFTPIASNPSFRINRLTFSSNATGLGF